MNKRYFIVPLVVVICLISSCQTENTGNYQGNFISYLTENSNHSYLSTYNLDSGKDSRIDCGSKEDTFWTCIDIYEGGNVLALNNDTIYVIDAQGIHNYCGITERVVAIKKWGEYYFLASQYEGEYKIQIFDSHFSDCVFSKIVKGHYSNLYKGKGELLITTYDEIEQKSFLCTISKSADGKLAYSQIKILNYAAQVIPMQHTDTFYFCVAQRVDSFGKGDEENALYKVADWNDMKYYKVASFPDLPTRILIDHTGDILVCSGMNTSSIYQFDVKLDLLASLVTFENESIQGLYWLSNRIVVITNRGIYQLKGKEIEQLVAIHSLLNNQYI